MGFTSPEESVSEGSPIELYEFRTATAAYYYTNAEVEISDGSNTFTPASITRTQPVLANERRATKMEVELPYNDPAVSAFAQLFIANPTEGVTTLKIQRHHLTDTGNTFIQFWEGSVISASYDGQGKVKLLCDGIKNIFAREGPRMVWGSMCQHTLFDDLCGLQAGNFTTLDAVVDSITNGVVLTLSALPSPIPYFVGGRAIKGNGEDYRLVVAQAGNVITLQQPFRDDFVAGSTVDITRGCDHTLSAESGCESFSNVINYGGAPFTPGLNPFTEGLDKL